MPVEDIRALERTRRDYDRVAGAYDELVRSDQSSTHLLSTAIITVFAEMVRAQGSQSAVIDVGCGPGQWTEHLNHLEVRAYGVDLSPEMVALARRHRPDLKYEVGSMLDLSAADGSVAGILASFSIIHLPPEVLPAAFAEFARVLEPGAPLLIGAQVTDVDPGATGWVRYDEHRASPSYRWTLDALAERLRQPGFREVARLRIVPLEVGKPPPGYLLTRYQPGPES